MAVQITSSGTSLLGSDRVVVRDSGGTLYVFTNDGGNLQAWKGNNTTVPTSFSEQDAANAPTNADYVGIAAAIDSADVVTVIAYFDDPAAHGASPEVRLFEFNTVSNGTPDDWVGSGAAQDEISTDASAGDFGFTHALSVNIDFGGDVHIMWIDEVKDMGNNFETVFYSNTISGSLKARVVVRASVVESLKLSSMAGGIWRPSGAVSSARMIAAVSEEGISNDNLVMLHGNAINATAFVIEFDPVGSQLELETGEGLTIAQDNGSTFVGLIEASTLNLVVVHHPGGNDWDAQWGEQNIGTDADYSTPSLSIIEYGPGSLDDAFFMYAEAITGGDANDIILFVATHTDLTFMSFVRHVIEAGTFNNPSVKYAALNDNFSTTRPITQDIVYGDGANLRYSEFTELQVRQHTTDAFLESITKEITHTTDSVLKHVNQVTVAGNLPHKGGRMIVRKSNGDLYSCLTETIVGGTVRSLNMYKSTDGGTTWREQDQANRFEEDELLAGASCAIDSAGLIYVVFQQEQRNPSLVRDKRFNTSTDLWVAGTVEVDSHFATLSTITGFTTTLIDQNDDAHACFTQEIAGAIEIFYSNKIGGTWKAAVAITAGESHRNPVMCFDDRGFPFIVHHSTTNTQSEGHFGNALNATSFTLFVIDAEAINVLGSVAKDQDGDMVVIYKLNTVAYQSRRHNAGDAIGTWQTAKDIGTTGEGVAASIMAKGKTFYVELENEDADEIVLHREINDGGWTLLKNDVREQDLGNTEQASPLRWAEFNDEVGDQIDLLFRQDDIQFETYHGFYDVNNTTHTTNSFLAVSGAAPVTVDHDTDALLEKHIELTHTTDAFLLKHIEVTHTTDALLEKHIEITHTTDSLLKKFGIEIVHTTDSLLKKFGIEVDHTTDAFLRKTIELTHTTDAFLRKTIELIHTTDAFLKKTIEITHTTDSLLKKFGIEVAHTTDSLIKLRITVTHTTDSLLKKFGLIVDHTTDAFLLKIQTLTHTTDAFLKRAVAHSTDAFLKIAVAHSTDAFLRKTIELTHTTDSFLRKTLTLTHTTDSLLKKFGIEVTHTTDSLLKKLGILLTHTTDAFLRKTISLTHTTDALLEKHIEVTHTTDSFLKIALAHSTDAFLKRAIAHTTDSFLQGAAPIVTHTTDALLLKIQTLIHTTDSLLKKLDNLVTHTTDSFLKKTQTITHTTDSLLLKIQTVIHTTDSSLKKFGLTITHTTDSLLKKTQTVVHTTDSLLKKFGIEITHTTDALLLQIQTLTHTTDALLKKTQTLTHTTDSLLKKFGIEITHTTDARLATIGINHTTDAFLRLAIAHSTDALLESHEERTHTTDAKLVLDVSVTHTTDSLLARGVKHTTDSLLASKFVIISSIQFEIPDKTPVRLTHTTDAKLVGPIEVTHTTDTKLITNREVLVHSTNSVLAPVFAIISSIQFEIPGLKPIRLTHTTDALLRVGKILTHGTNSFLAFTPLTTHTTDALLQRVDNLVTHTTDAFLQKFQTVTHTTDSKLQKFGLLITHTTDAFLEDKIRVTHTTDALLKKFGVIVSHTTDAALQIVDNLRTHTTDAFLSKVRTLTHTTDSLLKDLEVIVTHTTDSLLAGLGRTVTHTTDALIQEAGVLTHTTDAYIQVKEAAAFNILAFKREERRTLPFQREERNTLTFQRDERENVAFQ